MEDFFSENNEVEKFEKYSEAKSETANDQAIFVNQQVNYTYKKKQLTAF